MRTPTRLKILAAIVAILSATATAGPATAGSGDPALLTPVAQLDAALSCPASISSPGKTPILLVHGTFTNPQETWSWGYQRVLASKGYPVCTVTLPERAEVDLQVSAEYVVHSLRRMNALSGRKVSAIGHSQGGSLITWAMRFWPSLASLVDDAISIAGPMNGTGFGNAVCGVGSCPDTAHQLSIGSNWMTALTRAPLSEQFSFTSIGSYQDEVVYPAPRSTSFPGATNLFVQDVCATRVVGHLGLLSDAVAFALVTDALTHAGPASAGRVSGWTCWHGDYDGIDTVGRAELLNTAAAAVSAFLTLPYTSAEPALRDYAQAG